MWEGSKFGLYVQTNRKESLYLGVVHFLGRISIPSSVP